MFYVECAPKTLCISEAKMVKYYVECIKCASTARDNLVILILIVKNMDHFVEHAHASPHFVRRGGPAVDISSICTAKNCLSANI